MWYASDPMWSSVTSELREPVEVGPGDVAAPEEVPSDPVRAALQREMLRLQRTAVVRRTADLPVQAVLAGWKGECAAWRAETQRKARYGAASQTLPPFGWFAGDPAWWPEGLAVDPATIDLRAVPEVVEWVDVSMGDVESLVLSPLPEHEELTDPAVRLGLAVVRDAVMACADRAVGELREEITAGFVKAAGTALAAWYENRGAAPLAVVDEMRVHIEYAAARRHFVGGIAAAIEESTLDWAESKKQPHQALARLTVRMESLARAEDLG